MKKLLSLSLALLLASCALAPAWAQTFPQLVSGSITTQNLVPAGAATAGSAVELIVPANAPVVSIQVSGTYTGALSVQAATDSVNYVTLAAGTAITNVAAGTGAATITTGQVGVFSINPSGALRIRVTGLAAMTGTAIVTLRAAGF